MAVAALIISLFIAALGGLGLVAPETFVRLISVFQPPPTIYLAAAIRVLVGVILYLAAPTSRAPRTLRILGVLVGLGGLVTPFVGVGIGAAILAWWSKGGPGLVRVWAGAAVAISALIAYALGPNRREARISGDSRHERRS